MPDEDDLAAASHRWVAVCAFDEIPAGRGRLAHVNGAEVALMRDGDDVFGVGNLCPHRGGQISDGTVADGKAICPLHLWDFDLGTGVSPFNPGDRLPTYPARPDVYLGSWIRRGASDRGMYSVHHLADGGRPAVEAMGSERLDPGTPRPPYAGYHDLVFRPAQLERAPTLGDVPVDTSVTLGTRANAPLRLDIPIFVSHMSYGALSAEAKEALARGASAAVPRSRAARAAPTRVSGATPPGTSSRWPPGTSAGPRRTSERPMRSRSRSARAPNRGSAAPCSARKSPRRSPRCGEWRPAPTCTRRRASATSSRPRTSPGG